MMFFEQVPVLVLAAIVFVLIVIAATRKLNLGIAAVLGGVFFALLRGASLAQILHDSVAEVSDPNSLALLVLVASIMVLSNAMKKSGALAAFAKAVSVIAPSPRASLALTPLLIGTLPMPGGAIVSAPLVDALDQDRRHGPVGLTTVNYWFRHSLELAWPLYPAFILTCSITGFEISRLILLNLYSPLLLILLGQLFVIRREALPPITSAVRGEGITANSRFRAIDLRDLRGFLPIALLLLVYIVLDIAFRGVLPDLGLPQEAVAVIGRYVPAFMGVAVASLYVALSSKGSGAFKGALNFHVLRLMGMVAGIRIFSALLETGGLAEKGAAELAAWGIPAVVMAVILPFISGLVTGVGFAYVGIAMPIVVGLFPAGGTFPLEAAVVLAGAFGFAGMMLSPLHVCFVVTAEHFGARLWPSIRRIVLPTFVFLVAAVVYATILARAL